MPDHPRRRIAVVGSGIAGLTAAYLLAREHDVTVYEAQDRLGGHTHTHQVPGPEGPMPVDSGFIVHNDTTYPLLLRLFRELGVTTRDSEMSMSVRHEATGVEYAGGRGITGFLAQPRKFLRADVREMFLQVRRFHREATAYLDQADEEDQTSLGDWLDQRGYGQPFHELYAVPFVSCVWSSGPGDALGYPAHYLFRFLNHHGLLSVGGSLRWRTVEGGSSAYVHRLRTRLTDVRTSTPVTGIARTPDEHGYGVHVTTSRGSQRHDQVVVATHGDQALALLDDPTPREKEVLGAFRTSRNETVLHTDGSLLPRARWARASWNYLVPRVPRDGGPVATYWMNRLQGLPGSTQYYVSLNAADLIDPARVVARMDYAHPLYDLATVRAQRRLPELSTSTTTYAGAYQAWGFHEDGCRSGVVAAEAFGATW